MATNKEKGQAAGTVAGAATGAIAAGSVTGGLGAPAGAAIGGALGGMTGGAIGGMFDGEDKPWYDESWFYKRGTQIDDFENALNTARQQFLTSVGNMYNTAYARFSGNAEAGFAARGLAVNGGAFASALAKKTSEYQSQLEPMAYEAQRQDIRDVQKYREALFGQKVAAKSGAQNMAWQQGNAEDAAMGQFAGNVGMEFLRGGMGTQSYNPNQDYGDAGGPNGVGLENPDMYPRNTPYKPSRSLFGR